MPPPYVMGPQMQGAFDSTLGRLELLVLLAGSLAARDDASDSDSDDADSDSDSEEPTEERTLMAVLTMHAARRLRASAALNLGGRTRVTDAYAFDEHTCRRLFRFSAPQLEELTERMGLNAFGPKIVVGHDVFAPQEALLITLYLQVRYLQVALAVHSDLLLLGARLLVRRCRSVLRCRVVRGRRRAVG